jgi:hypothetical protein
MALIARVVPWMNMEAFEGGRADRAHSGALRADGIEHAAHGSSGVVEALNKWN